MEILDPRLKLKLFISTNTGKKNISMCNKCPENSEVRPNWLAISIFTAELAYHVNLPPLTAFLFINNAQFLLWQCPTHHISRTEGQCGVIRYQNHTLFGAVGKRRLLFICIGHFHRSCQNKKRDKISTSAKFHRCHHRPPSLNWYHLSSINEEEMWSTSVAYLSGATWYLCRLAHDRTSNDTVDLFCIRLL